MSEVGRVQNVISIALTADLPRAELKTLAEQIKQRLLRHPNIPLVDIQGFSDRQLLVEVPSYNIRRYGLSVQDIANIIAKLFHLDRTGLRPAKVKHLGARCIL